VTVLAIDQGTSATKAVVVADDGTVLAIAEASIQIRADSAGAVELDPEELWASVIAAADEALAGAGHPRVDAVGLANQGETVMAWDRSTGTPTGPAIVWQDRRAEVVCDRLREHGPFLAEHTGLELDPYFVAPKMVWLREQVGDGPTITTTSLRFTVSETSFSTWSGPNHFSMLVASTTFSLIVPHPGAG